MKVVEIFNQTKGHRKVTIEQEVTLRGGDTWYIVKSYDTDKRGETMAEEISFKSKIAAEHFAKMELEQ